MPLLTKAEMNAKDWKELVDRATWLLWVGHNLERIGDRVTNICERVIYTATGELVEINVSSG